MEFIEIETPENVKLSYQVAGLGSRFIAWFVDQLILLFGSLAIFLALFFSGVVSGAVFSSLGASMDAPRYAMGIAILVFGLGSFVYFAIFELLMRGQTPGKKQVYIRVINANGFSLSLGSVLMRNLFRVLDNIPLFWIVPFISAKGQRLGDIVAGTVLVQDEPKKLAGLRDVLLTRPASARVFRFGPEMLRKLNATDIEAIEKILERWQYLPEEQRLAFATALCEPLTARLQVPHPPPDQERQFLEDLLAAEYLRQQRQLG